MDSDEPSLSEASPRFLYISYGQFLADVEALAAKLKSDHWQPDFLVGIGRGGLVPAAYLSHRTEKPMLSVDLSSGERRFAEDLLLELAEKTRAGERILIVDDINDSGSTIERVRRAILEAAAIDTHVRVGVLLNNIRSKARVDYWAGEIDRETDKRWFVFPWEAMGTEARLASDAVSVPERLG